MAGVFRLINVRSHELERFEDESQVQYATLSHRWQDGEVNFQQMQDAVQRANMKGYRKIQRLCEQAQRDDLNYVWVRFRLTGMDCGSHCVASELGDIPYRR